MFDKEQALRRWRQEMTEGGIKTPVTLEELESHLLADFEALTAAGRTEQEAFVLAAARLGQPAAVTGEFKKLQRPLLTPARIAALLIAVVGLPLGLATAASPSVAQERLGGLLWAHVATLATGYVAALLAGMFAMSYVVCRLFDSISPSRLQWLDRAVFGCVAAAAGLSVIGFALGVIWLRTSHGIFGLTSPRAAPAWFATIWLVAVCILHGTRRISEHAAMLAAIFGNIVVSLAWTAAVVLGSKAGLSGPFISYFWPVWLFIAVHIAALIIGISPTATSREMRAG